MWCLFCWKLKTWSYPCPGTQVLISIKWLNEFPKGNAYHRSYVTGIWGWYWIQRVISCHSFSGLRPGVAIGVAWRLVRYKGWWFRNLTVEKLLELYESFSRNFPFTFFLGWKSGGMGWRIPGGMGVSIIQWIPTPGPHGARWHLVTRNPKKMMLKTRSETLLFTMRNRCGQCCSAVHNSCWKTKRQPTPSRSLVLFCDSLCFLLQHWTWSWNQYKFLVPATLGNFVVGFLCGKAGH